jgi:uncharacterized lipoprotein YajG
MHAQTKMLIKTLLTGSLICIIVACAKPYHLNVDYHLPEEPQPLTGQKVSLVVEDQREDKSILSKTALKEFDLWDGTYALALGGTPPPEPVQTYDLPALFHEAMKKRLEAMQIEVVDASAGDIPALIITLQKIAIDLKAKNWHSHIEYKAQLSRDSSKIAQETVSGQAERTKIMGIGGGQKLTGELFTDVINKLNVPKLFENAGLL